MENVGKYDITASVKASSNSNYTVTTKAGTLTVTQKAATATVGKFEKNYGDKDPKFTFTTEGLVTEGEELELPSITRAKGEDVGSYKVSLSFAEGSNTNYKLTIVPGSLTLLGGAPGIGKSTLMLQISGALSKVGTVLYISGEESLSQVKSRAERLSIFFLCLKGKTDSP